MTSVVSVWTDGSAEDVVAVLLPYAARLAGWQVEERQPLAPPEGPDGQRTDALAQVAFLRRPAEMEYDEWRAHWQGPHTQIAMETQAAFGYVQNRVTGTLTDDTPHVDAVVVPVAQQYAVLEVGAATVGPGSSPMVGLAPGRRDRASLGAALAVPDDHCFALRGSEQA